jgi:MFS family permease
MPDAKERKDTTPATALAPQERLSTAQRLAFWGSFGGWAMDGFNWTIFALILAPAMDRLLPAIGTAATPANVAWYGEISAAMFLAGWGLAVVWGPIADRFGRKPTMVASILVYGLFTGLAGLATNVWEWDIFRLLAAVGIGGEWAMAGTLLSEVMPENRRARFGGLMHSAAYWGVLLVSLVYLLFGTALGWRGLLLIGVLPALAVFLIRRGTPEPERWREAGSRTRGSLWQPLREVFGARYRTRTIGNLLMLVVCVLGLWAGSTYVPTAVTDLGKLHKYSAADNVHLAAAASMVVAAFTVAGCFAIPWLAARLGRRRALQITFVLMIVGITGSYGIAYPQHSIPLLFTFLPALGLGGASFAIFTIWLPEQYPTRMRATAFAVNTTLSRWAAAGGTFLIGYGIHSSGSLTIPLTATAAVFAVGLGLVTLAPETNGQTLPD